MTDDPRSLDLICLGRAAVDFYGEQIGSPLEDMQSFAKSLGGCAANIAVGAARQGLRVAMLTRVGDEHMGRFVRNQLGAEGVDTSHVKTDPKRLTGLVILAIRDRDTFPLIFYRENCADMAVSPDDFDRAFIASAKALLVTGTHFSRIGAERASRAAIAHAKDAGTKVILDIDYRPVLWDLKGHGEGEERFVESARVTTLLQSVVASCDLVVGTEEEIHIAGGSSSTIDALAALRRMTQATLVLKRGPLGCVVFTGDIPKRVEDGFIGTGVSVDVLNVLGAGDAFMSGFLRGWIPGESLGRATLYANACGALVVSRHGCAPAMPTRIELDDYIVRRNEIDRIDRDAGLNRLHRVTTREKAWPELCVLAFDHRTNLEAIATRLGVDSSRIAALKTLIAEGGCRAVREAGIAHAGMIIDDRYGAEALSRMTASGWWLARPIERSVSFGARAAERLLEFEGGSSVELTMHAWPREHVVKCLAYFHPDDEADFRDAQVERIRRLYEATVLLDRELLLEVIPIKGGSPVLAGGAVSRGEGSRTPFGETVDVAAIPRMLEALYREGIRPEWWKLPPPRPADWPAIGAIIGRHDPFCRGALLLGLDAPKEELAEHFRAAASADICKGFAVGRTIFGGPAERWLKGAVDDEGLVHEIALGFRGMIELWANRRI